MAQKKPSGKPIKITLTEAQISDIIQRAAKTRRSIRVESLEDRIAPSRIGLPIFGGAEDVDKLDDSVPAPGVEGEEFPEGSTGLPGEIFPEGDGPTLDGDSDGGFVDPNDPFAPNDGGDDGIIDPTEGGGDGILDPTNPDLTEGEPLPTDPDELVNPLVEPGTEGVVNPTVDEASNVEFNENLHLQGDAPDSGLTAEEMEEHRLNILRQLRG